MTDREKAQKPWYKKWWVIGIGVFFLIGILGSLGDAPESGSTTTTTATPAVAVETPTTEAPETTATTLAAAPTTQPEPQFTRSEENAIQKAEEYLDLTAFSRSGLIDQLEFEGFSTEEATYGVDKAGL